MKRFLCTMALATLFAIPVSYGRASAFGYSACANNNSRHCQEARAAFAEHHGGVYPEQYYNHWYQGRQGRWGQANNQWRYEGMDGDEYRREHNRWEWYHHHDRD